MPANSAESQVWSNDFSPLQRYEFFTEQSRSIEMVKGTGLFEYGLVGGVCGTEEDGRGCRGEVGGVEDLEKWKGALEERMWFRILFGTRVAIVLWLE